MNTPQTDPEKAFDPAELNVPSFHIRVRCAGNVAWRSRYPAGPLPESVRAFRDVCLLLARKLARSGKVRRVAPGELTRLLEAPRASLAEGRPSQK